MLAHERVVLRQVMDDPENRHGDALDRPGVVLVLHPRTQQPVEHADIPHADIRHDTVGMARCGTEPRRDLRGEPGTDTRRGNDEVLRVEEILRLGARGEVPDDGLDDVLDAPHAPDPQRHLHLFPSRTVLGDLADGQLGVHRDGRLCQRGEGGFPLRDYSAKNLRRSRNRASFEKTSTGALVGRRRARWMIRQVVCWLYSASVTAQPSRPARAVRPERCR